MLFRNAPRTSNISRLASAQIIASSSRYLSRCLGSDYIRPLSGACLNSSGLGVTAIDSLDTLIILGNTSQVARIRSWIHSSFTCHKNHYLSTELLTTHIIGGLISAYCLTGDSLYLEKAVECGDVVMRAFKGGPIPKPLVHGVLEASESYSWSPGIPLGGAGSFPLELQGLTAISGNVKYYRTVGPFFERVTSELNARKTFPVFLSKDPQVVGLAPMNIAFVANLLRTHLGRKTRITDELIKVVFSLLSEKALKNLMEITNTTSGRFDSKFCQLVPVLGEFEPSKFAEKLMEKCMALADERLPYASAKIRQNYLEVDDQEFAFDSSLIEYYLLKGDYLRELPYHKYLRTMECGNNILCGLYEQKGSIVKRDFLAPEALSRWLKLLLLDGLKLSYSGFVLNEVGHIIPVYSGPE